MKLSKAERRAAWMEAERNRKKKRDRDNKAAAEDRRIALAALGFPSYRAYLASDLWAGIRDEIIKQEKTCRVCKWKAPNQVHHICYDLEALAGRKPDALIPICGRCHNEIEFTRNGNKRTFADAMRMTRKLLRKRERLGRRPIKPPKVKKATSDWRRSKRGNLWKIHGTKMVTVFFSRRKFSWCVADRPGLSDSPERVWGSKHDTEDGAKASVVEFLASQDSA